MAEGVKQRRRYNSPARRERLDATRRSIASCARSLFGQRGYSGTTMEQIADGAGVAVQTVYKLFGTKANVLTALALDQPRGELSRLENQAVEELDPLKQLAIVANRSRLFAEASADLIEITLEHRRSDPGVAALYEAGQAGRRSGATLQIDALLRKTTLRPGLGRAQAIDLLWLLASHYTYIPLVVEGGWSGRRYERWLREVLARELLGAEMPRPGSPSPSSERQI
jgi:TetR/AcrR family transcriptional regulator, regulator of autoinduction and epiphytic fitness